MYISEKIVQIVMFAVHCTKMCPKIIYLCSCLPDVRKFRGLFRPYGKLEKKRCNLICFLIKYLIWCTFKNTCRKHSS